jgi:hypothetical protein
MNAQNDTMQTHIRHKIREDALIWLIIKHVGEGLVHGPTN